MTASNGDKAGVEQLAEVTPEMLQAFVEWDAPECPDFPVSRPRFIGFVRTAFMSGYSAALRNQPARTDGASNDHAGLIERRVVEIPMVAFVDRLPERDECCGEQTILTYHENVGVWGLEFFESGWEFPDKWLGSSHWIDITEMWPGVTAQVTEFQALSGASAREVEPVAWLYENEEGSRELIFDPNGEYARRFIELGYTEMPLFARTALTEGEG